MPMHHLAYPFAKILVAIALLLSFGLVGQTCSTQSPTVVFGDAPEDDHNEDDDDDDGNDDDPLPDKNPSSPMHGSLILEGRPLILDAAPNGQVVDCHSVISIYYSESMKTSSVNNNSFQLREKEFNTLVSTVQSTWLMGDRLLIIEPQLTLAADTTYQLTASEGPVDLDGLAYDPGSSSVLLEFTTAEFTDGIAPTIIASYPQSNSVEQPNDNQAVIVFSKAIDVTTLSPSINFINDTTLAAANYDTSVLTAARHSSDRVFSFDHLDDNDDLGANLRLEINDTVADASFSHLSLESPYSSSWQSMTLQRPLAVEFDQNNFGEFSPAANLANYHAFPLQVALPLSATITDNAILRIHQFDEDHLLDSQLIEVESPAVGGTVPFVVDLTRIIFEVETPIFATDSELLIASYLERGNLRTNVSLFLDESGETQTVAHDLIPPSLVRFGPPYGSFPGQFHSTLPIVRPYGVASESIGKVELDTDAGLGRIMPGNSDDTFFIGNSFDPALVIVDEGPVAFSVNLTDAAGNLAIAAADAEVKFSGFVGGEELIAPGTDMRVVAFDSVSLNRISGAQVFIENSVDGSDTASLTTGTDGTVIFDSRVGAQTVTVFRQDLHATTIVGVDASIVSLPVKSYISNEVVVSPQISNISSGNFSIGSNALSLDGEFDAAMVQEYSPSIFFGGVDAQVNRPAWFVSFYEVDITNTPSYYRFVGLEERVITAPSTSGAVTTPTIAMAESTNEQFGLSDYQYSFTVGGGENEVSDDATSSISITIPGLVGPAVIGAGGFSSTGTGDIDGDAELEFNLLSEAILEQADASTVRLNVYSDKNGHSFASSIDVDVKVSPAQEVIGFPFAPVVANNWADQNTAYPYTANFTPTITDGLYQIEVSDSLGSVWDIMVLASASGGGSVTFPELTGISTLPLSTSGGDNWVAAVTSYEMKDSFLEIGFFFDAIKRDRETWAKSKAKMVASF
ncbi:MAG: Ig-like domain-containing protein [Planctomycetes bacterium]|nr:Ig-like domain-containing protein [Planctomycetota bacterium]